MRRAWQSRTPCLLLLSLPAGRSRKFLGRKQLVPAARHGQAIHAAVPGIELLRGSTSGEAGVVMAFGLGWVVKEMMFERFWCSLSRGRCPEQLFRCRS